jgi:hypothetical protein
MKKFLGILVLGLLWCNVGFAEILELDHGIKINIPKNYEYLQFDQQDHARANMVGIDLSKNEIEDLINEQASLLGMDGTETTIIIAKKGYAEGYGDYYQHLIDGKSPESWSGYRKFEKKCGKKKSQKSILKCLVKFMKLDPMIQIDIANGTNEDFKEMASSLKEIEGSSKKEIKEINKSFEPTKNSFGSYYKNTLNLKIAYIDNKQWGFEIIGEENMMGMKGKRIGYIMVHNDHAFLIQGYCFSQTTCKNIKKTNIEIIQPYLSPISTGKKIETTSTTSSNLTKELKELNELYKSGALTKEEFEKAKKKLLN